MEPLSTQQWQESRRALRAWLLSHVRDPELAEDLTQDILLKAHAKLETLHDTQRFDAWLWSIARNALADALRRTRPHEPLPELLTAPSADEEVAALRALATCLPPLIAQLDEPYQTAIRAHELDGLTQAQLAEREGLSISGAKSRVQRGRLKLKKLFERCCHLERDHAGRLSGFEPRSETCGCSSC